MNFLSHTESFEEERSWKAACATGSPRWRDIPAGITGSVGKEWLWLDPSLLACSPFPLFHFVWVVLMVPCHLKQTRREHGRWTRDFFTGVQHRRSIEHYNANTEVHSPTDLWPLPGPTPQLCYCSKSEGLCQSNGMYWLLSPHSLSPWTSYQAKFLLLYPEDKLKHSSNPKNLNNESTVLSTRRAFISHFV